MATISGTVHDENGDLLADCVVRAYRRDTGALLASGLSGDGSAEQAGDTDYTNVVLLLHCDGTDGSTTFTDTSASPKTVSRYGDARISTAQSRFGEASAYFDGTGDYLNIPSSTDFALGSGDFTIESWVYIPNTTGSKCVVARWAVGSPAFIFKISGSKLYFAAQIGSAVSFTGTTQSLSPNTWTHVAVTRSGSTFRLFVDGVADATTMTNSGTIASPSVAVTVGVINTTDGGYFSGYIDDLRITKGVARYTANFTPPADPFEDQDYVPASPLGAYTLTTTHTGEVQVVALDPVGGTAFNDLILRTTPV